MIQIFYSGWQPLVRTLVIGLIAYVALVVILRISGKRTLSKMNAFDFIVTVALGSTLATVLLSKSTALADGLLALLLLVGLQFLVTWSSVRHRWVRQIVTGEPTMLLFRGQYLEKALVHERVTRAEVEAAVRGAGLAAMEDAEAVVLETDGKLTVIQRNAVTTGTSSLSSVKTPDDAGPSDHL